MPAVLTTKVLLTVAVRMDFREMASIVQVWFFNQREITESASSFTSFFYTFIYYSQMLMNVCQTHVMLMPLVLTPLALLPVGVRMDFQEMELPAKVVL